MKLQTERINQLADRIEQCKEVELGDYKPAMGLAFTMHSSKYSCGSPACILGHWNAIRDSTTTAMTRFDYASLASDLGITRMQAAELYAPIHCFAHFAAPPREFGHITKHHAAAVLRHLADTGKVDWIIGMEKI